MWRTSEPRRAVATIGAALSVAVGGWATARLLGIELAVDKGSGTAAVQAVDAAFASLAAGLAAWVTSILMARYGVDRWWPFVGSTALAVSMMGPSYQADGATAMALMVLHLVVGAVLMVGFTRPATRRCTDTAASRRGSNEPITSAPGDSRRPHGWS